MTERKLFVPALPPVSPGFDNQAIVDVASNMLKRPGILNNPGVNKVGQAVMMTKAVYDNLPPGAKSHLKAAINKAGQKVKDTYKIERRKGGTPMARSFNHSSGYSLSKAPNPIDTTLDTGLVPNIYTSDYLDAENGYCSPLHLSSAKVEIPTTVTLPLYNYFSKVIAFDLQSKAQANIGFNLNVNTDFTTDKIIAAMNALINALSIYYFYMSIISYHSDPRNKNEGMIALRSSITAEMIEDLSILGRRLADTPCPPNLLEFLRWLYGNYFTGDNQGSPMIKLVPHYLSPEVVNSTMIPAATDLLNLDATKQVFTLMRRSIPQWRINELRDVNPTPAYDLNFKTVFANLPYVYWNGTAQRQPNVSSTSTTIHYNTYSNVLDAAAFVMCSIYVTSSSSELSWLPGLLRPDYIATVQANASTRRSFYSGNSGKVFYPVTDYTFLSRARSETYPVNDAATTSIGIHISGTDRVKGVCQDTLLESAYNVLDYLMSLDTIKSSVKQSGFNPAASKGRTRR